ncbi:hypothetical protein PsorP6_014183 [Peronosclerospora sorghi]|uniref:Uncharacterized protein n=1 Tax=Peronosclerospora sorghi TaxID=230839 RepID=A0ACC0VGU9_9STRA|nr:hypothetical protein PsorP6_014183 [Peronosclerospora sorghi]
MIRKRLADENDVKRILFTRSVSSTSATFLAIATNANQIEAQDLNLFSRSSHIMHLALTN